MATTILMKAIENYEACYPDYLKLEIGDEVEILESSDEESEYFGWHFCKDKNGKKGWVSLDYIKINKNIGKVKKHYVAKEINAKKSELFNYMGDESYGWVWCKNFMAEEGWLPKSILTIVK